MLGRWTRSPLARGLLGPGERLAGSGNPIRSAGTRIIEDLLDYRDRTPGIGARLDSHGLNVHPRGGEFRGTTELEQA